LTNGIWEYINITTAGGSYIMAVNGVDDACCMMALLGQTRPLRA
jgi:hypothetical protein